MKRPLYTRCVCCGGSVKEIGRRSGYCHLCAAIPREAVKIRPLLAAEGWGDRGFDLKELAITVATAGSERGILTTRQQFVFSAYVVAAAAMVRNGKHLPEIENLV